MLHINVQCIRIIFQIIYKSFLGLWMFSCFQFRVEKLFWNTIIRYSQSVHTISRKVIRDCELEQNNF